MTQKPYQSAQWRDGPAELRKRLRDLGYAFLTKIIPRSVVTRARLEVANVLDRFGVLEPNADPVDLRARAGISLCKGDPTYSEIFNAAYRCSAVHILPHALELGGLLEALYAEPVVLLPAHMLRICFPEGATGSIATPYHQDFGGSQGSERAVTVWCPLGDYESISGTLGIAPRRHREGLFLPRVSSRGIFEIDDAFASGEVSGSVAEGDALIFTAFTPHRALPNLSNRVRVSVDFRFQPQADPVSEMFVSEQCPMTGCSWDKLYEAMPTLPAHLRHYWHGKFKRIFAHNNHFLEAELVAAMRAAEQGEYAALPTLKAASEESGSPHILRREAQRLVRALERHV